MKMKSTKTTRTTERAKSEQEFNWQTEPNFAKALIAFNSDSAAPAESTFLRQIAPTNITYDPASATKDGWYYCCGSGHRIKPEDARLMDLCHRYSNNRPFDQRWANELSEQIEHGMGADIAILPDGSMYLVNGQHTLWAICFSAKALMCPISFWVAKDLHSVARLYYFFDTGKKRTLSSVMNAAVSAKVIDTSNIPALSVSKYSTAYTVAHNGFKRDLTRLYSLKVERAGTPEYVSFCQWAHGLVSEAKSNNIFGLNKLIPQGVIATFAAMFISDRDTGEKFIRSYLEGGSSVNDPIRRLHEYMSNRPKGEHSPSVCEDHAAVVYTAWRFHNEKREAKRQLMASSNVPPCNEWGFERS